jgi:hypothetical protein
MYRFIISLLMCFIFILPGIAIAQESGNGTINGQVINDTLGGGDVAGLQVCLIAYVDDEIQSTISTATNESGEFRFEGLSTVNTYLISVAYMGVDYYYPVVFSPDTKMESVQISVCDSRESDDSIKVAMAHKIIDFDDDIAIITEMFILVNEGDHTYIGDKKHIVGEERGTLIFSLPQGATGFQAPPEIAEDFLFLNDGRVAYTVPFPPGELQLFFSYDVQMPVHDELILSFMTFYPTDYLDVMIKSDNIEVTTGQLAPAEPVETDTGERYIHYMGQNLPRDRGIDIRLTRLSDNSSFIFIVTVVILALVIVAVVVFLVKRKKSFEQNRENNDTGKDA